MVALFVLIVVLMLGFGLIRMLSNQSEQIVLEVNGSRAWAAGQSGLEWGLGRVLNRDIVGDSAIDACTAVNTSVLSEGAGLPNTNSGFHRCRVTMSCQHTEYDLGNSQTNGFVIGADAQCGPTGMAVSRQFETQAFD